MEGGLGTPEVVGIAAALMVTLRLVEKLVDNLIKRRNGNGHDDQSGNRPVAEWEQRIERVVERVVENKIMPNHNLMLGAMNDMKQSLMILIRWKGGD